MSRSVKCRTISYSKVDFPAEALICWRRLRAILQATLQLIIVQWLLTFEDAKRSRFSKINDVMPRTEESGDRPG